MPGHKELTPEQELEAIAQRGTQLNEQLAQINAQLAGAQELNLQQAGKEEAARKRKELEKENRQISREDRGAIREEKAEEKEKAEEARKSALMMAGGAAAIGLLFPISAPFVILLVALLGTGSLMKLNESRNHGKAADGVEEEYGILSKKEINQEAKLAAEEAVAQIQQQMAQRQKQLQEIKGRLTTEQGQLVDKQTKAIRERDARQQQQREEAVGRESFKRGDAAVGGGAHADRLKYLDGNGPDVNAFKRDVAAVFLPDETDHPLTAKERRQGEQQLRDFNAFAEDLRGTAYARSGILNDDYSFERGAVAYKRAYDAALREQGGDAEKAKVEAGNAFRSAVASNAREWYMSAVHHEDVTGRGHIADFGRLLDVAGADEDNPGVARGSLPAMLAVVASADTPADQLTNRDLVLAEAAIEQGIAGDKGYAVRHEYMGNGLDSFTQSLVEDQFYDASEILHAADVAFQSVRSASGISYEDKRQDQEAYNAAVVDALDEAAISFTRELEQYDEGIARDEEGAIHDVPLPESGVRQVFVSLQDEGGRPVQVVARLVAEAEVGPHASKGLMRRVEDGRMAGPSPTPSLDPDEEEIYL